VAQASGLCFNTGRRPTPRKKATADDFHNIISGKMNPMQAFMTGKIKVQGDTSLAMKLMPMING